VKGKGIHQERGLNQKSGQMRGGGGKREKHARVGSPSVMAARGEGNVPTEKKIAMIGHNGTYHGSSTLA